MSRIFSIDFGYKGETFTAVVTITKANTESLISVYVPDRELHHLLPDGKANLCTPQELQSGNLEETPAQEVINNIQKAIDIYEESKPPVDLW